MRLAVLMSAKPGYAEGQVISACRMANALDLPLAGIATSEDSAQYYTVGAGAYAAAASQSITLIEKELEELSEKFRQTCIDMQVAHEWLGFHGFMRVEWPTLSPYFDIAIVAPPLSAPEIATCGVSATMQLPDNAEVGELNGRCLVAWDGSAESSRAVRAALPLMTRFDFVDVMIVDPTSKTQPHDIGSYLASHDIGANIIREPSAGSSVAGLILEEANKADLVVMGAYGVSMTLERLFGGVTERMRRDCKTPIIFAN